MGLLATGTSCLADVKVMGRSRVPRPPERINPFISRPIIAVLSRLRQQPDLVRCSGRECWQYENRNSKERTGPRSADMKTLKEMLAEARQIIPEQPPAELKKPLDAAQPLVPIDAR